MSRSELEAQAKHEVCTCWFWALSGDIDTLSDDELKEVIDTGGLSCHYQAGIADGLTIGEFMDELADCDTYKEIMA